MGLFWLSVKCRLWPKSLRRLPENEVVEIDEYSGLQPKEFLKLRDRLMRHRVRRLGLPNHDLCVRYYMFTGRGLGFSYTGTYTYAKPVDILTLDDYNDAWPYSGLQVCLVPKLYAYRTTDNLRNIGRVPFPKVPCKGFLVTPVLTYSDGTKSTFDRAYLMTALDKMIDAHMGSAVTYYKQVDENNVLVESTNMQRLHQALQTLFFYLPKDNTKVYSATATAQFAD